MLILINNCLFVLTTTDCHVRCWIGLVIRKLLESTRHHYPRSLNNTQFVVSVSKCTFFSFKLITKCWINVLENTKGAIKNDEKSRETGNIGYTRRRKTKLILSTICVGYLYTQTDTHNINKTWALLQTTRGNLDEPNIVFFAEIVTDIKTRNSVFWHVYYTAYIVTVHKVKIKISFYIWN